MRALVAATCLVVLHGCGGDDDAPASDGGSAVDGGGTSLVAAPAEAALPSLACPDGWRTVMDSEGVSTCDPWPASGAIDCGVGEVHLPGTTGCAVVGASCPSGSYADVLPTGTETFYVDASATAPGTGSSTAPFQTIGEAIAAAGDGAVIALAKGAYDERVVHTTAGVTIVGACAKETTLTFTTDDPFFSAISVQGGALAVQSLRITDTGVAAVVSAGATLTLTGVQIDGMSLTSVLARDSGRLVMQGTVIRDTRVGPDPDETGRAVTAQMGGVIEMTDVVIERSRDVAMFATGAGSRVTARGLTIRDVTPREDGSKGRAVEAINGVAVDLERVVIEDAHDVAILVGEVGTTLSLTDAVVRRTEIDVATGDNGRGIEIVRGAVVTAERVLFDENRSISVFVRGAETTASFTDVVVARTRPRALDDDFGRGVEESLDATMTMTRVYVVDNNDTGILVTGGANLTATDLVVHRTHENQATLMRGSGLAVQLGATATVERMRISENREEGVFVLGEDTTLDATDVVVRDTQSWALSGVAGTGLAAQNGARVTLTRSLFERNRNAGVLAFHAGTSVTMFDVAVHGTRFPDCDPAVCPAPASGFAAVVGGQLEATRFVITTSELSGVQVDMGGQMDLHQGEIRDNPIGAAIGDDDYDLTRLSDQVAYSGNGVNLDAQSLPVPTAIGSVDGA